MAKEFDLKIKYGDSYRRYMTQVHRYISYRRLNHEIK